MAKSDYIPNDDGGKSDLFVLFRDNITPYLGTWELQNGPVPVAEITQQAADATYFRAVVDFTSTMQQAGQGWTAWKNFERDGGTGNALNPVVPVLPAGFPPAVPSGIVPRIPALLQKIKAHKNYTEAIGQTLGIEGSEGSGIDFATLKPVLKLRLNGSQVEIPWGWQGYSTDLDSIEIQVDRGDGKGFGMLTIDTTVGYTDTAPFPATVTQWTYRAIYRLGDDRVGQWSDEISINVG